MSLTIVRCQKCGRVFPYYYRHARVDCQNIRYCRNRIWLDEDSTLPITLGLPEKLEPDNAYVFVNAFNGNVFLSAKVTAIDGGNTMVIPIDERKLGLTRKDSLDVIPSSQKHLTAWDGLVVPSGNYPISELMRQRISAEIQLYQKGQTDEIGGAISTDRA